MILIARKVGKECRTGHDIFIGKQYKTLGHGKYKCIDCINKEKLNKPTLSAKLFNWVANHGTQTA